MDSYVCTVEVRPTDDIDRTDTVPELNIISYDPSSLTRGHTRVFTAHEVPVGKDAHAMFKSPDCQRIDFVYWRK